MLFLRTLSLAFLAGLLLVSGCTAPRSVIHSGKVTPKGEFKAGFNYSGNIATQPLAAVGDAYFRSGF